MAVRTTRVRRLAVGAAAALLALTASACRRSQPHSKETAVIATLLNLRSAQTAFRESAMADADGDGTGEYGTFLELCAEIDVRGDPSRGKVDPPPLSGAFRSPSEHGWIYRSGYRFAIWLPAKPRGWVCPDAEGWDDVDADHAEREWRAYAWPVNYGNSGNRTFLVDESGTVVATDDPTYGALSAPRPDGASARRQSP